MDPEPEVEPEELDDELPDCDPCHGNSGPGGPL